MGSATAYSGGMNEKQKASYEAMLGAIQRRAMEIVELPVDQREARHQVNRTIYLKTAAEMQMTPEQGQELADKFEEFTRAMVKIMETGGGAGGGRA
jgi:hypothetical protein